MPAIVELETTDIQIGAALRRQEHITERAVRGLHAHGQGPRRPVAQPDALAAFLVGDAILVPLALAPETLVALAPTTFRVIAYRKGSWTDAALDAAPGTVVCTLSLGLADWPAAWGGHGAYRDRAGAATAPASTPAGTVELADGALVREVAVVTRHVERLELRTLLGPAPEAP